MSTVHRNHALAYLKFLLIVASKVSSLHDLGLLACTFLDHLELGDCLVTAADPANRFAVAREAPLCIPTQLSLLTNLSHLQVDLASSDMQDFDGRWLYKMASIESLVCTIHGTICLDNRLTQLRKLQDLQVLVTDTTGHHDEWKICYYAIDWEALHQLTHSSFSGPSSFDESILRLTSIDRLKTVSLWDGNPTDDLTAKCLAMLSYKLAADRPEVTFLVSRVSHKRLVAADRPRYLLFPLATLYLDWAVLSDVMCF